jgi:hypothetical protein
MRNKAKSKAPATSGYGKSFVRISSGLQITYYVF